MVTRTWLRWATVLAVIAAGAFVDTAAWAQAPGAPKAVRRRPPGNIRERRFADADEAQAKDDEAKVPAKPRRVPPRFVPGGPRFDGMNGQNIGLGSAAGGSPYGLYTGYGYNYPYGMSMGYGGGGSYFPPLPTTTGITSPPLYDPFTGEPTNSLSMSPSPLANSPNAPLDYFNPMMGYSSPFAASFNPFMGYSDPLIGTFNPLASSPF